MYHGYWHVVGLWIGLLYGAGFVGATIWLTQLAYSGYPFLALRVLAALTAGLVWAMGLCAAIWCALGWFWPPALWGLDIAVIVGLFASAWAIRSVPMMTQLSVEVPPAAYSGLIWKGLMRPLRFWGTYAFGFALLGLVPRVPPAWRFVEWMHLYLIGLVAGLIGWFGFFVLLGRFGRLVPPDICLHSLNKLRFLSVLTLFGLGLVKILSLVLRGML